MIILVAHREGYWLRAQVLGGQWWDLDLDHLPAPKAMGGPEHFVVYPHSPLRDQSLKPRPRLVFDVGGKPTVESKPGRLASDLEA